jgi:hypothetical protein
MMATAAMNGAIYDALHNMFWKLKTSKTYEPILATPLDVSDIAVGEALVGGSPRHDLLGLVLGVYVAPR